MRSRIKQAVWLLAATIGMIPLWGCVSNGNGEMSDGTFVHQPANAVYHWKTVYNPNAYEKEFLKKREEVVSEIFRRWCR